MASEGDFQNSQSIVGHTKETTHINDCYYNYQTNKEAYQSYSEVPKNYVNPQHSRKIAATSQTTDQCSVWKQ